MLFSMRSMSVLSVKRHRSHAIAVPPRFIDRKILTAATRHRNGSCRTVGMSAAVSVVVPTCGRPDLLRRCIAALEAQTLPPARYEIIVVDDTASRRGPAAARNIGWRRASAPIVAFTDDDTTPEA